MDKGYLKYNYLKIMLFAVGAIFCGRLLYLQVFNSDLKTRADGNALRYQVQHPPRGEVYDRRGEFLVQSKESYDLVVIPRDVEPFDTVRFAEILGVTKDLLVGELNKASAYSRRSPSVIFKQLSQDVKLKLDEKRVAGFYAQYRTVRTYPRKLAGNLLGYVGEVNDRIIRNDPYYKMGDYIGMSGIEQAYEEVLRGKKGVKIEMVDTHGVPQGSYLNGKNDTLAQPGHAIVATIDARLQALAEELMRGKIGSVVAIEPATGEILVMASSPSYDPDLLVGRERGNNYMNMVRDVRHPIFNRAVMARYPPGSTFKVVNGLLGMQFGVAHETDIHSCYGGYPYGRGVGCHAHNPNLDMSAAVQNSCNAYFCYVFRDILERSGQGSLKLNYDKWREGVLSFGFGRKLDSDFQGELKGNVPSSNFYNKTYRGQWNALTVISLSIGQGELGCTPLQMANLAATVANRGYYYIPHVVKKIEGRDSIDARFYKKNYTVVDPKYFTPIVDGMYRAVHEGGGTAQGARIDGFDVCGKTGTAQNGQGANHSTFMCFAPRDNPRIAVSVYVEHGGYGASMAVPIASMIVEEYLTDTIKREDLRKRIGETEIYYPMYREKVVKK
ncbi:MAG: penicillin-binding transpeptidase domain-containing protein [Mucinivorans sp.]